MKHRLSKGTAIILWILACAMGGVLAAQAVYTFFPYMPKWVYNTANIIGVIFMARIAVRNVDGWTK